MISITGEQTSDKTFRVSLKVEGKEVSIALRSVNGKFYFLYTLGKFNSTNPKADEFLDHESCLPEALNWLLNK